MQDIFNKSANIICPGEDIELSVSFKTSYKYQWLIDGQVRENETNNNILTNLDGIYTCEVGEEHCKRVSNSLEILYKDALPKPELIAFGPTVWILACHNDTAQNYQWYYNGEIISGASDYIYVANQDLGEYYVSINDGGECYVSSDIVTIPLSATGINDMNIFGDIKIYPNPTPGVFTIEMDNQVIGSLYIRISNSIGREIFNIKHSKTTRYFQTQMNLSGQGAGIYFIEFRFENNKAVRKIIVE